MAIQITSTAFPADGVIPKKYTCDGDDISPPLQWSGVPDTAKSLALIVDDPDAPSGIWTHWVVWNLPTATTGLPEHVRQQPKLDTGAHQGVTDFHKTGYNGPCPPHGSNHRYRFTLYALDTELSLEGEVTRQRLLTAMQDHILAERQLVGHFGH